MLEIGRAELDRSFSKLRSKSHTLLTRCR
jgi:hypothetical protein